MNLDGFAPTPVVGNQYKKADGTKITVVDIDYVEGQLYVLYEINGEKSSVYQDGWNDMHLTEIRRRVVQPGGSVPPPPENPDSGTTVTPDGSEPTPKEDKVQRLQDLLDNGPTGDLNPNFYPTDFAQNVSSNELVDDELVERLEDQLKDIQELREHGKDKKAGFINEFLWACAGVDKPLLRMCQSDWSKKAGIGGTILGTAILAFLSGTYAAYTVSGTWWAGLIGLVWGLFIFNLDRYLVNSMYSDGTSRITMQEWKSASPRLIIALFIGVVISTPVEMLMFDGKIQEYCHSQNALNLQNEIEVSPELQAIDIQIQEQKKIVETYQGMYNKAQETLDNELLGKYGTVGRGPNAKRYEEDRDQALERLEREQSYLRDLEMQKKVLTNNVQVISAQKDSSTYDFSTRLEAMLKITGFYKPIVDKQDNNSKLSTGSEGTSGEISTTISTEEKEKNPLFWVRLLIMCFFMIIEITPVLAKMMADDGKYEEYIILESKTMDKLRRVRECNDINVLRGGYLSMYSGWILGMDGKRSVLDMEDDKTVQEGNTSLLVKEDGTKKKKLLTDADNLRIYEHALKRCTDYVISQIDEIFDGPASPTPVIPSVTPQPEPVDEPRSESQDEPVNSDPSDDAISIA